ncbi:7243_t:CDS:2, partial [Diversispora eburnea]
HAEEQILDNKLKNCKKESKVEEKSYRLGDGLDTEENLENSEENEEDIQDNEQTPSVAPSTAEVFGSNKKSFQDLLAKFNGHEKIDDLIYPDKNDLLMKSVVRIIRKTLPSFIMAFSMGSQNSLLNLATLEKPHLNTFIHPCLQAYLCIVKNNAKSRQNIFCFWWTKFSPSNSFTIHELLW